MSLILARYGGHARRTAAGPVVGPLDTFDGTGSDLGPGWSLFSGAGARANGQGTSPTSGNAQMIARKDFDVASSSMFVELDWVGGDAANDRSLSVAARFSGVSQTYYSFLVNDRFDRFGVYRTVNGERVSISEGFQPMPGGVTPPAKMRLEVVNDTAGNPVLKCFWAGQLVAHITDLDSAAIKTGACGGLVAYNPGGVLRWDNFQVGVVSGSAPAPRAFIDRFDGAAGGLGSAWTTWGTTWSKTGAGQATASGTGAARFNVDVPGSGGQFTEAWVGAATNSSNTGVYARMSPSAQTGYLFDTSPGGDWVHLLRVVNGNYQQLIPWKSMTVEPGGLLRLEVRDDAAGNPVLRGFIDGVLVVEHTDTSSSKLPVTTGRRAGLQVYQGGDTVRFNYLSTGAML